MKKKGSFIVGTAFIVFVGILIILSQQPTERTHSNEQPPASNKEQIDKEEQHSKEEENNMLQKKNINKQYTGEKENRDSELVYSLSANSGTNNREFTYSIKNEGSKNVTIDFSTSQRYEVILIKNGEGEVYRYSEGRMFMQVLGELTLKPGESENYSINLPTLKPGDYNLSVNLVGKNVSELSKRTIQFTVID